MSTTRAPYVTTPIEKVKTWFKAAPVTKFPSNGGACVQYKGKQIAVFNFTKEDKWYACQNLCPHKMEMVLSRGMIGDAAGIPKVACPLHKKTFSLDLSFNEVNKSVKISLQISKFSEQYCLLVKSNKN